MNYYLAISNHGLLNSTQAIIIIFTTGNTVATLSNEQDIQACHKSCKNLALDISEHQHHR